MAHANGCLAAIRDMALASRLMDWVSRLLVVLVTTTVVVSLAFVACATQARASV